MAANDYRIQIGENTKTFHANMLRKYVSRENSEDKRMNDDVVQRLQLVSEYQDSQLGSEDTMFCPLEATESWTDVSICPQLTDVQQVETRRLLEEYRDVFSDLPGCIDIIIINYNKTVFKHLKSGTAVPLTGVYHGVLIINLESQLRLAAEVTGNSLSALLASHSYHVHMHICLCLRTLGLYIMIVNLTFRHCFNVSDRSVFILTKCHSARGI